MSFTNPNRPDFSGEWILNRDASTLSPGADGVRSATWHIDHREPAFRHKASFETASDPIQWEYELRSDDAAGGDAEGSSASRLRWDGDALVVHMRVRHPGGEMTIVFRHELLDGGRRLRAAEQLRGTDHDQDNVWVFDRR
jgi:hypothetical protein